jgi:hypothetical protein
MTLTYPDKPSIDDIFRDILTHTRVNANDVAVDAKFKLITGTRVLNAADATVEYSGIGFSPSAIIFFTVEPTEGAISWGLWSTNATGYSDYCVIQKGADSADFPKSSPVSIFMTNASLFSTKATVSGVTSDSFYLDWVKTAGPARTATFIALCIR